MAWAMDPLEALRRWPADLPVVMLHSGRLDAYWSRYSLLAQPHQRYRFEEQTAPATTGSTAGMGRSVWIEEEPPGRYQSQAHWTHQPFVDLGQVLERDPSLWVGYFGYDLNRFLEPRLARPDPAGGPAQRDRDWPLIEFARCPGFLVHDALTGRWTMHGEVDKTITDALSSTPTETNGSSGAYTHGPIESRITPGEHEAAVVRAGDYIAAGDVFQVNLAQRLTTNFAGSTRGLFQALAKRSPAWYGAYLEFPVNSAPYQANQGHRALISTSPELFLDLTPEGVVTTRPIKGTAPAEADPRTLQNSEKDAAELNMIVDLLRNDLGRVCKYGSVRVCQPRTIESHPTVHHGVATITGQLDPRKDLVDLLRATLPGGSITGAPKVRAMQIIDELEPVRRGPYCGAIGFIHGGLQQTTARFNIAIRTMLAEMDGHGRGRVDYSVGGGIVADSDPASEYQETLDKAAAMHDALNQHV